MILGRRTAQNRSNKLSVRILEFVFLDIFVDFSGNKLWMLMEKKNQAHVRGWFGWSDTRLSVGLLGLSGVMLSTDIKYTF